MMNPNDPPPDMSPATPPCTGALSFGGATEWTLPTGYRPGSWQQLARDYVCGADSTPTYVVMDLTGDGRLDVVVTRLCGDPAVGDTRWVVHRGQDGGFGGAEEWTLPTGYRPSSWQTTAREYTCGTADTPSFTLMDVTGDGKPDLVVTKLCGDGAVGDTRWVVHRGGDSGFGGAEEWTLPTGYRPASWQGLARDYACGTANTPTYVVMDVTGDRRPDVVVTRLCGDGAVGDTRWVVHRGGDHGFGAAEEWTLPTGYRPASWQTVARDYACGTADTPSFSVMDVSGDGQLDIVVTRLCGDAAVGDTRWVVHRGGTNGFGGAEEWTLPTGYRPGSWQQLARDFACGTADTPSYVVMDVSGDRRPDVVITRLCGDGAVGDTRWVVHRGRDGGFDGAEELTLPTGYRPGSWQQTARDYACGTADTPTYALLDATADRRPDAVVTRLCGDAAVGDTRWVVHPLSCR